jgi:hypothetical protein
MAKVNKVVYSSRLPDTWLKMKMPNTCTLISCNWIRKNKLVFKNNLLAVYAIEENIQGEITNNSILGNLFWSIIRKYWALLLFTLQSASLSLKCNNEFSKSSMLLKHQYETYVKHVKELTRPFTEINLICLV